MTGQTFPATKQEARRSLHSVRDVFSRLQLRHLRRLFLEQREPLLVVLALETVKHTTLWRLVVDPLCSQSSTPENRWSTITLPQIPTRFILFQERTIGRSAPWCRASSTSFPDRPSFQSKRPPRMHLLTSYRAYRALKFLVNVCSSVYPSVHNNSGGQAITSFHMHLSS